MPHSHFQLHFQVKLLPLSFLFPSFAFASLLARSLPLSAWQCELSFTSFVLNLLHKVLEQHIKHINFKIESNYVLPAQQQQQSNNNNKETTTINNKDK